MLQNTPLSILAVFLGSYLVGSIPWGYLIGRLNGIDIRKYGSHNIGATNVTRVLGAGYGRLCFVLDFLKGWFPVVFFGGRFSERLALGAGWCALIAAAAAVIGHVFPVWLKFKGGKGVATSVGVCLAMAFWPVVIGGLAWFIVYRKTLVVAIASLTLAVVTPLSALALRLTGLSHIHWHAILLMFLLGALIIVRHHENIRRLVRGEENSFKAKA